MQVFNDFLPLKNCLLEKRANGGKIGFVPTMGALHKGHARLIETSVAKGLFTVCSIYVNPTQFNNPDDLKKYPRTLQTDKTFLEGLNCDVLFYPTDDIMYPTGLANTQIQFGNLEKKLEGKFRPGHFKGVGLVVAKLFHLVQPDVAFFGQKDLQQFAVIKQLVTDLFFPLELERVPTVRNEQGLALSSRNSRLSEQEQQWALHLYKALSKAKEDLLQGKSVSTVHTWAKKFFEENEKVTLEYFEIVDADTFEKVNKINPEKQVALCVAAYVGGVRLIDNLLLFSS